MQNKTLIFFILIYFVGPITIVSAQDTAKNRIERAKIPDYYLELKSDFSEDDPVLEKSDKVLGADKEVMQRISDIYEIHVKSVRAQVENDPLSAEKYLTAALEGIQQLLKDFPELPGNDRFNELYRTVYTEYRSFYGIEKAENQVRGEIFTVQRELYENEDDWFNERYVLPENITKPETEVPLVQNEHVNRHLTYYTVKRPQVMQAWLNRSKKYFPMMKKIFREEGVPTELVHLSMIESGLNPRARSWASAVGMWQFIQATGSVYGLEVNWWMDERRDPEKATRAAAQHLKDLYEVWGDWYLAIANYNISPRGLNRAIRAGGGEEDYWSAYEYLPRETQGYIPGFIATTMIDMNAEAFGFKTDVETEPYDYAVANVAPLMPLEKLAEAAHITEETLKDYNPELLRWATPPGGTYPLKLPVDKKEVFLANYSKIPKDERGNGAVVHSVSRGETLGHIAQKYGTTVRAIYESNEQLNSTIYPGQKMVVPLAPGSAEQVAVSSPTNRPHEQHSSQNHRQGKNDNTDGSKVVYDVKRGDTIGHIAEWYDVRASQIRNWNNTSNTINVGERLNIYIPASKKSFYQQINGFSRAKKNKIEQDQRNGKNIMDLYAAETDADGKNIKYRVRKNDTLIEIANAFGVSVAEIKRSNNLDGSRIYEGQHLRINKIN